MARPRRSDTASSGNWRKSVFDIYLYHLLMPELLELELELERELELELELLELLSLCLRLFKYLRR